MVDVNSIEMSIFDIFRSIFTEIIGSKENFVVAFIFFCMIVNLLISSLKKSTRKNNNINNKEEEEVPMMYDLGGKNTPQGMVSRRQILETMPSGDKRKRNKAAQEKNSLPAHEMDNSRYEDIPSSGDLSSLEVADSIDCDIDTDKLLDINDDYKKLLGVDSDEYLEELGLKDADMKHDIDEGFDISDELTDEVMAEVL